MENGAYVGVSASNLGGMQGGSTSRCPTFAAPPPLTIANGQATSKWGGGSFDGQVSPDGTVRLRPLMEGYTPGVSRTRRSLAVCSQLATTI